MILRALLLFMLFPTLSLAATLGTFQATANLKSAPLGQTATTLVDGRVLIAGGCGWHNGSCDAIASAEIYDPAVNTTSLISNLNKVRSGHTATRLPDGSVLVAGGNDTTAELFSPGADSFAVLPSLMTARRAGHTATLFVDSDGKTKVLIIGGTSLLSAEIFDPETKTFTATASLSTVRDSHSAVLLNNGKVLVTGGRGKLTAELYDPATHTFAIAHGTLTSERLGHRSLVLSDGTVLLAAGDSCISCTVADRSAELFDPATETFSPTINTFMERTFLINDPQNRGRIDFGMFLLDNGFPFIVGGTAKPSQFPPAVWTAEVYNPATGTFVSDATTLSAHSSSAANTVRLNDGSIFLAGGYSINATEKYTPTVSPASPVTFIPAGSAHGPDTLTTTASTKQYPITLDKATCLGIAIKSDSLLLPTWSVTLTDAANKNLLSFAATWFDMRHVSLEPGQYTVTVGNINGGFNNPYILTLFTADIDAQTPFEQEPNDTLDGRAEDFSRLTAGLPVRGRLQQRDAGSDQDMFKITLNERSRVSLTFDHEETSGSWNIVMKDAAGLDQYRLISDGLEFSKAEQVLLPAGDYTATVAERLSGTDDIPYTITYTAIADSRALNARASLPGGTYSGKTTFDLLADNNASIYYTLDGSMPTTFSSKFDPAKHIVLSASATVRFFARDASGVSEPVRTETYVIRPVVNLSMQGNVAGTVYFSPSGMSCSTACSVPYDAGSVATITALGGGTKVFAGWATLCSGTLPCQKTISLDQSLVAYFYDASVRIKGTLTGYYGTIGSAYTDAAAGAVIEARAQEFVENLVLSKAALVTINGGYDGQFGTQGAPSQIRGALTVQRGVLIANNLVIR